MIEGDDATRSPPAANELALNKTTIAWQSHLKGAATKPEAFSAFGADLTAYDGIESAPHWPSMPKLYDNVPALPKGDQGAFDELLDRFNPETESDKALIASMFITAFWAGGLGQRPAFIITSKDGYGSGKSAIPEMVAYVCTSRNRSHYPPRH